MAAKLKRRKRRRSSSRNSDSDEIRLDDIEKDGIDEKLDDIAAKTNLTAINVKSILHHILKDKRVLRMALNAARSDKKEDGEDNQSDRDDKLEYPPKLTRSRLRRKVGTPHQTPVKQGVASHNLSPTKLESDLYELLNRTLSDSSDEDIEYKPDNTENAASDRESEASGFANESGDEDVVSVKSELIDRPHDCLNTTDGAKTSDKTEPITSTFQTKEEVDVLPLISPSFAVQEPLQGNHLATMQMTGTEDGSSIDISHISDTDIFAAICTEQSSHSDITSTKELDLIADRTRSRHPLTETSIDDLEANFLPPDIPPDLYELIENPAADDIAWQQWLTDLMKTDKSDQTEENEDDDPEYKAPQDVAEEEEEYRTDMAVKVSYKELSYLLEEFIDSYNTEMGIVESETDTGLMQVSAASENTNQLLELMANAGVSVTDLVEEMDDADKTMTTEQLHMIASQLQQHVQLLCQTFLLSSSDSHFSDLNIQSRNMLLQLRNDYNRAMAEGRLTMFDVSGISEVEQLVNQNNSTENDVIMNFFAASDRSSHSLPPCAVVAIASALGSQSPLFPYLEMLPQSGLVIASEQTAGDQRVKFTAAEDNLMALGIVHYDKKWNLIQSKLLPSKTLKQLQIRYKNLCSARSSDNPVKRWKRKGELALVETPVYSPTSLEKVDALSGVELPDWLISYYRKQMNPKSSLSAVGNEEPGGEKVKRKRKSKKCEDRDDTTLSLIAPAVAPFGVAASVSSFKVLAARPAVLNEHDYGITGCGVDGNVGGTRKMVVQYVYPAGPVNNSESKKEGSRTLNQIFSERSILVLPSVSDTNSKPPPLTSVTMNPQGTMTTSAIRVPISSTGTPHVPRKSYCGSRAVTQKLLQESDPKASEKAQQFAKWYLSQVQALLQGHSDRYSKFVEILLSYKSGKLTARESWVYAIYSDEAKLLVTARMMYEGVQEVLSDWPDLVRRFVGFLGPDEALSAGLVADSLDFAQALSFLRKLEVYFRKAPHHLQKIVKTFRLFPHVEGHVDQIYQTVLPLLKHRELIDDFSQFFKPKSLLERFPESFEVIEMDSGSDIEVDEFEEIRLSSSSEREDTLSSSVMIRCKICRKLVKRQAFSCSSHLYRSGNSKQKDEAGNGKATAMRYCNCKGRRRNQLKANQSGIRQPAVVSTTHKTIEASSKEKLIGAGGERFSSDQLDESNCIEGTASTSDQRVSYTGNHLASIDQDGGASDNQTNEMDVEKDITAGSDVDLEFVVEDKYVFVGDDTEGDTNLEHSISPESVHEPLFTESETDDSIKPGIKLDELLDCEQNNQGQLVQEPADNETVGKDGHVLTWTKSEDRIILSNCQQWGLSHETFELVARQIEGKTPQQVELRIHRLLELFQSSSSQ